MVGTEAQDISNWQKHISLMASDYFGKSLEKIISQGQAERFIGAGIQDAMDLKVLQLSFVGLTIGISSQSNSRHQEKWNLQLQD